MSKKNNISQYVFLIVLFFVIFPQLIPFIIFIIIYFIFLGKNNTVSRRFGLRIKAIIQEFLNGNISLKDKEKLKSILQNKKEKIIKKSKLNYDKLEGKVLELFLKDEFLIDEAYSNSKLDLIFTKYGKDIDLFNKQKIISNARHKFKKIQKQKQIKLKLDDNSKKPDFIKKSNLDFGYKSIWNDYESVLDLMKRNKNK